MKKSRYISMLLVGALLVGGSACSQQPLDPKDEVFSTFTTIEECTTSGLFSPNECMELARNAIAQSPRFNSLEECEAQFGQGQCNNLPANPQEDPSQGQNVQQGSGSSWMPMMMGFMAGRMLGGGGFTQGAQPLYRDPGAPQGSRSFRTPTGDVVRPDASGRVTNPSPKLKQNLSQQSKPVMKRTAPKSRGGFKARPRMGRGFGG